MITVRTEVFLYIYNPLLLSAIPLTSHDLGDPRFGGLFQPRTILLGNIGQNGQPMNQAQRYTQLYQQRLLRMRHDMSTRYMLPSAFAVAVGLLTAGFLGVVGLVGPAFVGAGLAFTNSACFACDMICRHGTWLSMARQTSILPILPNRLASVVHATHTVHRALRLHLLRLQRSPLLLSASPTVWSWAGKDRQSVGLRGHAT
jgi:hypothetical protein